MWTSLYIAGAAILFATAVLAGFYLRTFWKLRGDRVIRCPENREFAAVVVDARRAGITAILGEPALRLRDCTRWPERQDCGQECLSQIEAAPHDCLVRTILTKWHQGKACVHCHRPFDEINWLDHKPALRAPDGKTVEWRRIAPQEVPVALTTHLPVCWNCHIAETFRREHSDLIVDRDWGTSVRRK